jgi:hypothetical protein
MMKQEFDDSIIITSLVGNILKSEVRAKQKIARERFDQIHKLYLKNLSKPKVRAEYKGRYLLVCSQGCVNSHKDGRHHFEIQKSVEAIRAVFDLHLGHDFVLLHESIVRHRPIRKLREVKRIMKQC